MLADLGPKAIPRGGRSRPAPNVRAGMAGSDRTSPPQLRASTAPLSGMRRPSQASLTNCSESEVSVTLNV